MELIIFDLDGTLIDSRLDLANAVNAARTRLSLGPIENERVYSYVGNGAPVLMRRALGAEASDETVRIALEYFLDYYGEHKLDCTRLYPGVLEALDRMKSGGATLAVLTNKPVGISQAIVDGLGLRDYFFRVYGGNSFERKKPDPMGIERLMEETGVQAGQTLMVGDSSVDVRTARNAGVPVAGVSYGFQPESLAETPPDYLVDRMEAVADIVIASRKGELNQ
ncbi:MAG: HAD-IA family hydrolase [Bryobacterales bacterium]|nr:HAD-IA family hydrolase [Bryobacterales bacterium]